MKKIKSITASLLAIVLIVSSLAFSCSAFAKTFPELKLNTMYTGTISGGGDMIWYTYTPEESGTYSLISYSSGKTIAYLYTRTVNPNGSLNYNGIDWAADGDPDYMNEDIHTFVDPSTGKEYTHGSRAFRLTCHLDAGTRYYFSAGYPYESTASGTLNVLLRQDSVDSGIRSLTGVSAVCNVSLIRYFDGEWKVDSAGERYYKYNTSKVISNTIVTLHYSDGTSTSAMGENYIDGYRIMYSHNQENNHWYMANNPNYTQNIMTVSVSDISYDYSISVDTGESYNLNGVVLDYTDGLPLEGINLYSENVLLATTDSNGRFTIYYPYGTYYVTLEGEGAFTREIMVTIINRSGENNHASTPVTLFVGDYVSDGIINGKDAAYISKEFSDDVKSREMQKFRNQFGIRFRPDFYDNFSL